MKIFGVGLSKTGTTSLNAALEMLGLNSAHNPEALLHLEQDTLTLDLVAAEKFDAITDLPVARFFRELDDRFPGSKFVLTTRDLTSWLRSAEDHFYEPRGGRATQRLVEEVYGAQTFDAARFKEAFERHTRTVSEYFRDRPGDLLILDTAEKDKWGRLCAFLGVSAPSEPYPHSNSSVRVPRVLKQFVRSNKTLVSLTRRLRGRTK